MVLRSELVLFLSANKQAQVDVAAGQQKTIICKPMRDLFFTDIKTVMKFFAKQIIGISDNGYDFEFLNKWNKL